MKRYRALLTDFDTRANVLKEKIEDHWEEKVKKQWLENKQKILEGLKFQYGESDFDSKAENFKALGPKPFSIISYHNSFFAQVRSAFVMGSYYPSLAGACALGERILNHLLLSLRDFYKSKPEYKKVYRNDSFDNWAKVIDILESWGILDEEVANNFRNLEELRNRSLHFNLETYANTREDALSAIITLSKIIDKQFGTFGTHRWFLEGTKGVCFIKKEFEKDPFVKTFYLPQCAYVGPYHQVGGFNRKGFEIFDFDSYDGGEISDEEFCRLYNERKPEQLAPIPD